MSDVATIESARVVLKKAGKGRVSGVPFRMLTLDQFDEVEEALDAVLAPAKTALLAAAVPATTRAEYQTQIYFLSKVRHALLAEVSSLKAERDSRRTIANNAIVSRDEWAGIAGRHADEAAAARRELTDEQNAHTATRQRLKSLETALAQVDAGFSAASFMSELRGLEIDAQVCVADSRLRHPTILKRILHKVRYLISNAVTAQRAFRESSGATGDTSAIGCAQTPGGGCADAVAAKPPVEAAPQLHRSGDNWTPATAQDGDEFEWRIENGNWAHRKIRKCVVTDDHVMTGIADDRYSDKSRIRNVRLAPVVAQPAPGVAFTETDLLVLRHYAKRIADNENSSSSGDQRDAGLILDTLSHQPPVDGHVRIMQPLDYHVFKDGNKYCAVYGDFENLSVFPAGFADLPAAAVDALEESSCRPRKQQTATSKS
jgi:hypothetical protein